jgi:hypothetical protein
MFTLNLKLFVTKRNKLTVSKVTINVFTIILFRQSSSGSQKGVWFSYVTTTLELQRNKLLSRLSGILLEGTFAFDTCSLFWNVPYKSVHTTETTALSSSWKKTPTAIPVFVSKLYFTFCGAAAKLKAVVTVCDVPRSHTVRHRHNE